MNLSKVAPRLDFVLRGTGPVFIHADLLRTRKLLPKLKGRREIAKGHVDLISKSLSEHRIWIPTFNYDFPITGVFNVMDSKSQVGPLTEYFRTERASWRTEDPIFSCSGTGPHPNINYDKDLVAFDKNSIFGQLDQQDGSILFYGAKFSAITFIHYVEQYFKPPLYRYDKSFYGIISMKNQSISISYSMHVWPKGLSLKYDFDKLLDDLKKEQCVNIVDDGVIFSISARILRAFWVNKLKNDPLYFLDEESKQKAGEKLNIFGRRFILSDFEKISNT